MKILWVVNIILPEASNLLGININPFGGWLVYASQLLAEQEQVNLFIASPYQDSKEPVELSGERIKYLLFPWDKDGINNSNNYAALEKMLTKLKPDLVHTFGTEYSHALGVSQICKKHSIKSLVSIQGLVSVYTDHYMANLPCEVQRRSTLRDILKKDTLKDQQRDFHARGLQEKQTILNTSNIIGRTRWDQACAQALNKEAKYYKCNENLRESFYKNKWSLDKCRRFSIFASQASYPIKGIHQMLKALPEIIREFPDTVLYIAGQNILDNNLKFKQFRLTTYSKYICKLIDENNLHQHVVFTGVLKEEEMCDLYLKSHVFVCPSAIENSPNSLGEAMILGVPSVSSYVGGVPDMLEHSKEGFLYQQDAEYMLAYYVKKIFSNDALAEQISKAAREKAKETHNLQKNTDTLVAIYQDILNLNVADDGSDRGRE